MKYYDVFYSYLNPSMKSLFRKSSALVQALSPEDAVRGFKASRSSSDMEVEVVKVAVHAF